MPREQLVMDKDLIVAGDGTVETLHYQTLDPAVLGAGATTIVLGNAAVDGSWRITIAGDNLSVQRRESAVWVEKGLFIA